MPDPLDYRPPRHDRRLAVSAAEWVLAALVAAAFAGVFAFLIWLLIRIP